MKQKLTVLKTADLRPFPGNPFHLVEDEQLMELSESIKEFGMAAPILTRAADDGNGYEVIAGQRQGRDLSPPVLPLEHAAVPL